MQDVIDSLVRLADRAGGTEVSGFPEPLAHLAAFVLVMLWIGAAVVMVGLAAAAVASVTDGSGWARWLTSFEDMLGHCRSIARLHWWVAYPESLVRTGLGPSRESTTARDRGQLSTTSGCRRAKASCGSSARARRSARSRSTPTYAPPSPPGSTNAPTGPAPTPPPCSQPARRPPLGQRRARHHHHDRGRRRSRGRRHHRARAAPHLRDTARARAHRPGDRRRAAGPRPPRDHARLQPTHPARRDRRAAAPSTSTTEPR
jgi:hypothetical protein